MNKTHGDNSAFPLSTTYANNEVEVCYGKTIREDFASKNMAALLNASFSPIDGLQAVDMKELGRWAVNAADSLIEALNEKEEVND